MDSSGTDPVALLLSKTLEDGRFKGCEVRGLPVGEPFRSIFSAPKHKLGLFSKRVYTFIIIPVPKPELLRSYYPTVEDQIDNDISNVKIELPTEDADHEIPNKSDSSGDVLKCQTDKQSETQFRKQRDLDTELKQSFQQATEYQIDTDISNVKIELPTEDADHEIPIKSDSSGDVLKCQTDKQNATQFRKQREWDPELKQSFQQTTEDQIDIDTLTVKTELPSIDADHEMPNECHLSVPECQTGTQIETQSRKRKVTALLRTGDKIDSDTLTVKIELPSIDADHEIPNECHLSVPECQTGTQIKTKTRKRKVTVSLCTDAKHGKVKDNDNNESDSTGRRSSRLKAAGCRPDYKAMLDFDDGTTTDEDGDNRCALKKGEGHKALVKKEKDFDVKSDNETTSDEEDDKNFALKKNNDEEYLNTEVDNKQKKAKKTTIRLEDHTDKYKEEIHQSYSQKDRGKEHTSMKLFTCSVCKLFRTKELSVLELHIEKHINGELHCVQCDFVASHITALYEHKRTQHKRNVGICPKCGKEVYKGKAGLKNHLGKEHNSLEWNCSHCVSAFATDKLLRAHIKLDHTDTCVTCSKGCDQLFINELSLHKHVKYGCPGKLPSSFPCEICGKVLKTQSVLNDHISRLHNNIRSFLCPHCPYTSRSRPTMARHVHTHTGNTCTGLQVSLVFQKSKV